MLDASPSTTGNITGKQARPGRTARSRVTNGRSLLPGLDGRSTWARRVRDLLVLHVNDLGGPSNVSEAERAIVRRAAVLITELERMEAGFALTEGSPDLLTLDAYQRGANSLRRLLEAVGLQRRAVDVTPSIGRYLRDLATAAPAAEAAGAFVDAGLGDPPSAAEQRTSACPEPETAP